MKVYSSPLFRVFRNFIHFHVLLLLFLLWLSIYNVVQFIKFNIIWGKFRNEFLMRSEIYYLIIKIMKSKKFMLKPSQQDISPLTHTHTNFNLLEWIYFRWKKYSNDDVMTGEKVKSSGKMKIYSNSKERRQLIFWIMKWINIGLKRFLICWRDNVIYSFLPSIHFKWWILISH